MAPQIRPNRFSTADKENIPLHNNSKIGVATRSPWKKKKGLSLHSKKPCFLATVNSEADGLVLCGPAERRILRKRVEKVWGIQPPVSTGFMNLLFEIE